MEFNYSLDDWKMRIINASPTQLVLINIELILDNIHKAKASLSKNDIEGFVEANKSARNFLAELIRSIDENEKISVNLYSLYFTVNKRLLTSFYKKAEEPLEKAEEILLALYGSYKKELETMNETKPVIENAERVYSGLTYGRGSLNETVDSDGSRGFKA